MVDEFDNPKDKINNFNQKEVIAASIGYANKFAQWSERDIETVMLRDRNRPSIIMWSIGNEIEWTYPEYGNSTGYWSGNNPKGFNYYYDEPAYSPQRMREEFNKYNDNSLGNTAMRLSAIVKRFDQTRPITANLVMPTLSSATDYGKALDIIGYSYRAAVYDYGHKLYSDKLIYGGENWAKYHEWEAAINNDYVAGVFLWTGICYLGEAKNWPNKGSDSGLLDFAAFKKPPYYLFKSVWNSEPMLKIYTQEIEKSPYRYDDEHNTVVERTANWWRNQRWGWHNLNEHWDYSTKDTVIVEVYGNCPVVELFLDKTSLGIKKLDDFEDKVIKWAVPYKAGKLSAVGYNNEQESLTSNSVITPKSARKILLEVDKSQLNKNDNGNVSHIVASIVDGNNNPINSEEFNLSFDIQGPNVKIYGVDNGASNNVQDYQATKIKTSNGRALLIVGHNGKTGDIKISAKSGKLKSNAITINVGTL